MLQFLARLLLQIRPRNLIVLTEKSAIPTTPLPNEKDRDSTYTPHPSHQAFVASLQPHVEKVFVIDY